MANLAAARQGRIKKALAKRFTFEDGVATLGARIRRYTWHRKDSWVQRYGKERCLEKPLLKHPKTWYTIWRWENEKETGLTVPKVVWEHLAEIPEEGFRPYEPPVIHTRDPLQMDTVCPICGGEVDWTFDNSFYGPARLECGDFPEHTPRDLDLFNNLGPDEPPYY